MSDDRPIRRPRRPDARLRATVSWGARLALVGLMTASGLSLSLPTGPGLDFLIAFALGLALLGLGALVVGALRWLVTGLPRFVGPGVTVATAGALMMLLVFNPLPAALALSIWAIWLVAVVALVVGLALALGFPGEGGTARPAWVRVAGGALGLALFGVATWWWLAPGPPDEAPLLSAGDVPPAPVSDPGAAGALPVAIFSYGGGAARWRGEYASDPSWRTEPIDLADLVEVGGITRAIRDAVLGHGLDAVPRNAVVWHPADGEGPFPLVLVMHGNANLFLPSELGYAYLGEHLASRGYVVASIDASAFNGLPVVGGLSGENDARALLLLAHLDLWRGWHAEGREVARDVDLGRIALVGHSRGGEAAAHAAALDALGRLPEDATAPLAERVGGPHGIDAVIAIAPSDRQYSPGDRGSTLDGVDYLVLQGGYDADVASFVGERQYERTELAPGGLKAAVYLHHANHGQFNTEWGRFDVDPPFGMLLRTGAIMPAEAQRRAGAALITAFLEATLAGEPAYREVFRDPRSAPWLPATAYVTRVDEGGAVVLAGFDEDVDPTTGSHPGTTITGEGLAVWREGDPRFRSGTRREGNAVTLGWRNDEGSTPSYRLALPEALAALAPGGVGAALRIDVARGAGALGGGSEPVRGALDVSVVVEDSVGRQASVPLSRSIGVPPDLPSVIARLPTLQQARYDPPRYPLYQSVQLPLAWFVEAEPELDLADARSLAFVFDRVPEGSVVVRQIALVPGVSPGTAVE
jgi:dienelactone hydrolase